jgi:hypothetical protein
MVEDGCSKRLGDEIKNKDRRSRSEPQSGTRHLGLGLCLRTFSVGFETDRMRIQNRRILLTACEKELSREAYGTDLPVARR